MQYRLIQAAPVDDDWLERLRRSCYRDLFDATWGGWDEARHRRHFSACLELGHISIIEVDGVRVGMLQLIDEAEALQVAEIQVDPAYQNRGIGSAVLADVLAAARGGGKRVHLRVGLKNDKALRLYLRMGFRRVSQSATHDHLEFEPRG